MAGCLSGLGCSRWLGRKVSLGHSLSLARAPSGPLSVSSTAANCYSLQKEIVVMLCRFPVKVRDCKKVSLVCFDEPNRDRLLWLWAEEHGSY